MHSAEPRTTIEDDHGDASNPVEVNCVDGTLMDPGKPQGTAFAMQSTEQDRAVAKLHAQAAQWEEYDDEYDDSFDGLGGDFGADAGAGEYIVTM